MDRVPVVLGMLEEEYPRVPSNGWAEMIRKVYEVDPMNCPRCGGRMRVMAILIEYAVADRILSARRGPGAPDLKFLTLVPGRDILFL